MTILLISCNGATITDPLIFNLQPYDLTDTEKAKIKKSRCIDKRNLEAIVNNKEVIDAELGL